MHNVPGSAHSHRMLHQPENARKLPCDNPPPCFWLWCAKRYHQTTGHVVLLVGDITFYRFFLYRRKWRMYFFQEKTQTKARGRRGCKVTHRAQLCTYSTPPFFLKLEKRQRWESAYGKNLECILDEFLFLSVMIWFLPERKSQIVW